MSKKQVTFADIAAYTHFSKTTISRYFNHPDSLTLENQEKISQALLQFSAITKSSCFLTGSLVCAAISCASFAYLPA